MAGVSLGTGRMEELYSGPVIINLSFALGGFPCELSWTVLDICI